MISEEEDGSLYNCHGTAVAMSWDLVGMVLDGVILTNAHTITHTYTHALSRVCVRSHAYTSIKMCHTSVDVSKNIFEVK